MKSRNLLTRMIAAAFLLLYVCCVLAGDLVEQPFKYWQTDKSQIVWGAETNGIKAGLMVRVFTNLTNAKQDGVWCVPWLLFQTNSGTRFYVGQKNSSSNYFAGMIESSGLSNGIPEHHWSPIMADAYKLLPIERNYQVNVADANGVAVTRTEKGEMLKNTFRDNPVFETGQRWSDIFLKSGEPSPFVGDPLFYLNDYFKFDKPGKYHLQIQIRIFCCYAYGKPDMRYEPLIIPPVDVEFSLPDQKPVTK